MSAILSKKYKKQGNFPKKWEKFKEICLTGKKLCVNIYPETGKFF
jgi:hypothetical protein